MLHYASQKSLIILTEKEHNDCNGRDNQTTGRTKLKSNFPDCNNKATISVKYH